MEEPLFMFQLIIAVDVSEHRSIYNKLNAPCSGDFNCVPHTIASESSRANLVDLKPNSLYA